MEKDRKEERSDVNKSYSLDIIIPVYNEGENIKRTLDALGNSVATPFRLLICYDYDDDDTLPVLYDYRQKAAYEMLLVKNEKKGAHGAVLTGFKTSDAPAVLVFAADDDYNAGKIDLMYEKFKQGYDIVCASRFIKGGCMRGCPLVKSFLVRASSFTLYWTAGIPTHDASNGFRLFSRRLLDEIVIESEHGFTYSLELLAKCHRLGWKICEIPVSWFQRKKGKSRFRVAWWLPHYLRWYFYAFATAYLKRPASSVKLRESSRGTQDRDAERHFFDNFAEKSDYSVLDDRGVRRIVDEFLKYFTPKKDLKVLDFGCGTGSFISKFRNYGLKLYGIDISPNCIRRAKDKYPDIIFDVGDIEHTKHPDRSFDAVFLCGVLHHFTDFSRVLQECYRILKKDAIVLAYEPHKSNPFMWLYKCKNSPFYLPKSVTENERPLTKEEIKSVLTSTGFSECQVYSISGVTFKCIINSLHSPLLPVYNLVEMIMDFKPFRKRFGSFLIAYAKK